MADIIRVEETKKDDNFAALVAGGARNGLTFWKNKDRKELKSLGKQLHFVALCQVDGAILVEESKFEEAENCLKNLLDANKNWPGHAEKVHAKLKEM